MQELKVNDKVYTKFGYGVIVTPPTSTTISEEKELNTKTESESSSCASPIQTTSRNIAEPVEILRSPSITEVKLKWGGSVFLDQQEIKKKVNLKIKTFYGNRKTINVEASIAFTIQNLKDLLLSKHLENARSLYDLRLIYPMGTIQELKTPEYTIEHYQLPDNAGLILLAQTTFTWDNLLKGGGIKISNNNLTATKTAGTDYQTVLGNLAFSSGSHYWEIKIEKFSDEEDLFIGIARKELDLHSRPIDGDKFYGYMSLCAQKVGPHESVEPYGYQAKKGDMIGVLLEYKSGFANLSFYKNGVKCGIAFSNLTGSFYPAVSLGFGDVQVTLDPKASVPLN